ncbi:pentatricopeptide repeat-containing protein At3g42630 [Andrographis paniculata]|uniref:pentatricopeptide repeat-containing protein At3g42630 n=1 Tax=Andrographis paniculata TaxID=175694 RepID=UPI0021E7C6C4|nr:pentatricopeptide repeat-containing protein At3g42630 [Andrographis paniculata]
MEVVPPLASTPLALNSLQMKNLYRFPVEYRNPEETICRMDNQKNCVKKFVPFSSNLSIHHSSRERLPLVSQENVHENKPEGFLPWSATLSVLLMHYARNGFLFKALEIWDEMMNSSFVPDIEVVSELIVICGNTEDSDTVTRILHQMQLKDSKMLPAICYRAISEYGRRGQLNCMENMLKQMVSMGYKVDSATGNAYVSYYSAFGSVADMEAAYGRLKRSRILIEEEAIRSMSFAYIKEKKFYALGCFLRDVGLGRRNVGNLLWNLLLLSYAANFKMKSLQREFVRMVEAGFYPDLNTFNIRLLAFSRMSMLWDLHLSLEHMKHDAVVPDLVTYGCVVDAYVDRRLGKNLKFGLSKFNWDEFVSVSTDPLVFEAMGKGDFHLSSEGVLEYRKQKDWTYRMLASVYLKKLQRGDQIFWNY